tara:strand:- start:23 stop:580 length:558 start_codon:yes stop_codon:yes gene_type:complete
MALINIPTSGIWASIASALNSNFSGIDGRTGYATYTDTQYTIGSPLVVAQGTTVDLANNAGVSLSDQLPTGVTTLYDGLRLVSNDNRAAYVIRINFTVANSSQTGSFELNFDISAAGDGSIPILSRTTALARGANTPQPVSYTELYFSRETFVDNGALLKFTAISGTSSIYGISYVISKIHKGRV